MDSAVGLTADEHFRVQKEIEKRAYELWLKDGCCDGRDLDNWLQAEREFTNSHLDRQRKSQAEFSNTSTYEH